MVETDGNFMILYIEGHSNFLLLFIALLGSLGYLEGSKGHDFLEFIVRLCALPTSDQRGLTSNDILTYLTSDMSNYSVVTNSTLKEMCDNILMLMTKEAMEAILWPYLIDFLLAPEYMNAIPSGELNYYINRVITYTSYRAFFISTGNLVMLFLSAIPQLNGYDDNLSPKMKICKFLLIG